MTNTEAADVLDALEAFISQLHCGAQNAGLDTLIEADLPFSQFKSLLILSQTTGPLPIHELAENLRLSVGATGRNVEQLVQDGLVDRQEDSADRRIKRISLTVRGRDLITGFREQHRRHALGVVESLDESDRQRLLAALQPIVARFADQTATAPTTTAPTTTAPANTAHPKRLQEQHV